MFFIVRRWQDKPSFSKVEDDPRQGRSWKLKQSSYVDIIHLTPLGEQQTIETLAEMWIAEMFTKPSPFKEKEPEKPKALSKPKPPKKQIIGAQE
jgi:hypothetical protein